MEQRHSITSLHQGYLQKEFSVKEITELYLERAQQKNAELNAYLELFSDTALKQAQGIDEAIAQGTQLSPLAGIPLAIKDNILIEGQIASAGSKMLEKYKASYDAGVIRKLKEAGAVFLGRTNMDEFAMGSSTENSAFGPTKNPHDLERVPGGSSGGSATAVAADLALASLGSDTGGSIRQPAHFCSVVGLKPTYGAVSRSGLIAMASSLDQIGPFAKTVEDAALLFSAIAGKDGYDNTSIGHNYGQLLNVEGAKKLRIGVPKEYFASGIDEGVKKAVEGVIEAYRKAGLEVQEISLPHTKYALSIYYIIMPAEVSSNLARFDGIRYSDLEGIERSQHTLTEIYEQTRSRGFGIETKRRIILGTFVLSSGYYDAYYKKASQAREYIKDDFNKAFENVDVILGPVAPTPAFKLAEKTSDPLSMYMSDILTIPASLAGLPAISIPVKDPGTLPIGFQLIGKHWAEGDILSLGKLYEDLA
ncbi:MAG: Asp-tRNA(Asn)/Glu-tRNA(Gln) amidotransferase subunit GatA [Candidatus Harrisonbacteria bacterium]|nr:Asp-tRNA(Asn)/Glu-tRNA(Gln) amidotransferase subunit GatA [Candidatus Harrisonbacteria bacterium]